MRHHDDCRPGFFPDVQNQFVEAGGTQRIKSCGGLVEKENIRVQCERTRKCGAFHHAAGEIGGHVVLITVQIDQFQFLSDFFPDFRFRHFCVFLHWKRDIFRKRKRTEQGASLVCYTELPHDGALLVAHAADDALSVNQYIARNRSIEPDHVFHQRAFAAAGTAEDRDDLPCGDVE